MLQYQLIIKDRFFRIVFLITIMLIAPLKISGGISLKKNLKQENREFFDDIIENPKKDSTQKIILLGDVILISKEDDVQKKNLPPFYKAKKTSKKRISKKKIAKKIYNIKQKASEFEYNISHHQKFFLVSKSNNEFAVTNIIIKDKKKLYNNKVENTFYIGGITCCKNFQYDKNNFIEEKKNTNISIRPPPLDCLSKSKFLLMV